MRIAAQKQKKIVASVITILVVTLLVIAGPAAALQMGLTGFSVSAPIKGEIVSTTATIDVQSNERISFDSINLILSGAANSTCTFDVSGNNLTTCEGIEIDLLSNTASSGYGYGYGYGYNYGYGFNNGLSNGQLKYNITLNTTGFAEGDYSLILQTSLGGHEYKSSTQSLSVLAQTQQHASEQTEVVENGVTEVVIDSGSSAVKGIVVPSNVTGQVNLSLTAIQNASKQVSLTNTFTLTRESSSVNYSAEIPSSTVIDGGAAWDGKLSLPTVLSNSGFTAPSGTVDVVVDMGSTIELNFSQPVKVVIGGMAGKKAAWARGSSALNSISTVCDSATSPTNIDKNSVRECSIDNGSDLVIWTYHFTSFSAYTPQTTTPSGGSGSRTANINYTDVFTGNDFSSWKPTSAEPTQQATAPANAENTAAQGSGITGNVAAEGEGMGMTGAIMVIIGLALIVGVVSFIRSRATANKESKKE
ncbi:MAG TPA: hypothetical protein VHA12_02440 [Candidatus Nanoarchaeia archaeon]|nr:hypothetical protein [Candidatus Nanoarchaeia archaeon]